MEVIVFCLFDEGRKSNTLKKTESEKVKKNSSLFSLYLSALGRERLLERRLLLATLFKLVAEIMFV